jgi:hypothetical protein
MLTTLPPSCAVVMKSGNLNFLEPSGPLQAGNGSAYYTASSLKCFYLCRVILNCISIFSQFVFTIYSNGSIESNRSQVVKLISDNV